jgi:peptide/nickel transport system substrate-binding protein
VIRLRTVAGVLLGALVVVVLAAWGSSDSPGISHSRRAGSVLSVIPVLKSPWTESLSGKRGGVLTVLQETDFDHLDPGIAYYDQDYEVVYATQRPLYSNEPDSTEPSPDMASGPPVISNHGKTVTVKLKRGVHFSPPVNREVTSADVAYAIERGANPNVANPYIFSYFNSIEGISRANGGPIKGIVTPNKHEIAFKLTEPDGQIVAEALQLPLSAPVPKEYAEKFDKHRPSNYADYEVATGPYMLKNNAAGKVLGIGYKPGRSATLVRNPNWRRATDLRPAYLNEIRINIGGANAAIGREVLEGKNVVENEPPAQATIKLADEKYPSQLEVSPGAGSHYIAVNNQEGPFSNIDLRKAFWAALDRTALDAARGGELTTDVATHFIYPTIPGFEQAGGLFGPKGPQFDFDEHPEGDIAIAEKYIKLAGYPSGKYTGGRTVTIVGANEDPAGQDAEMVNQTLKELGFATNLKLVETATMYAKYCNVPGKEVDVCPNVGWVADFADPETVLNLPFNGDYIVRTGNVNWGQTNVPRINAAMTKAELITGTAARATAWAKIDEELVEDAAAIPFDWDKQANIEGSRVNGVGDLWNIGAWDYSWSSLK